MWSYWNGSGLLNLLLYLNGEVYMYSRLLVYFLINGACSHLLVSIDCTIVAVVLLAIVSTSRGWLNHAPEPCLQIESRLPSIELKQR